MAEKKRAIDYTFEDKINYIRKSSIGTPKRMIVDLSVALNNEPFYITGNFFYIIEASDFQVYTQIRFNETREPAFTLNKMMGFYTPYYRFYLTHPAQGAGTSMTIVYGTLSRDFLDVIDNRTASIDILEELQGDVIPENWGFVAVLAVAGQVVAQNANRKSLLIQHDRLGVGTVYLGCDNTVAANNHFISLNPGDVWTIDDFRGAIWAIRSAGATNLAYLEV